MFKKNPTNDFSINSLVGENTFFHGEFESKGQFRIDGHFKGKINSSGKVYIGKDGIAECTLIAQNVVIGGTIIGDVFAEGNVEILKTGKINGNIYASSMNMDDTVSFDGECKIMKKDELVQIIEQKRNEKYTF